MTETDPTPAPRRRRLPIGVAVGVAIVVVAVAAGIVLAPSSESESAAVVEPTRTTEATATPEPTVTEMPAPPELDEAAIGALPAAIYSAVIPGLLAHDSTDVDGATHAYTAASDVPVFGDDLTQPVARIPALNFLDEPTTIVPVELHDEWALVLTASRQTLPSETAGAAAAQSAGWVPLSYLQRAHELTERVVISVSEQTLTVRGPDGEETFEVGVGTDGTPTPTGTAGYIQARYDDPTQADYTIQLTTLHSAAADEPFGGSDGGLIGLHYNLTNSGTVSHGCVRLPYDALLAVNRVGLGTPVIFEE